MTTISTTKHLSNGCDIPRIGLGVYQIPNGDETYNTVREALNIGYRHIDTAAYYKNEESVGKAIRESFLVRRDIWVTTKLWLTGMADPRAAFYKSLKKLGLEYIDLYLIHWPFPGKTRAWKILESLVSEGVVRSIGVSNYSIQQLEQLQSTCNIKPVVNQIEFHPFLFPKDMVEYAKTHDIAIEAYSPLTRGKKLDHPTIAAIAKTHTRSPAQILLRWALQHDCIILPKSRHAERLQQNLNVFDFELTQDEMEQLNALDQQKSMLFG